MVALFLLLGFGVELRLFLVIRQGFRCDQVHGFRLVWGEDLCFQFELLVDDSLHGTHQNVDHYDLSGEITANFQKEKPLKTEVQAFSVHQVLQRLNIEDGIRAL